MIDYGRVKGITRPEEVEMTDNMVFVASNINTYVDDSGNEPITGYEYNYKGYTKDEYINTVTQSNAETIDMLLGCVLEMSEIVYQ